MQRMTFVILAAIVFAGISMNVSGQGPTHKGALSALQPGQSISLVATSAGYDITNFPSGPVLLNHKVIEVGADYVVVEEMVGISTLRIPIYAIRSVITMRGANK